MFHKRLMLVLGFALVMAVSGCGGGEKVEKPQTFQDAPGEPPKRGIAQ